MSVVAKRIDRACVNALGRDKPPGGPTLSLARHAHATRTDTNAHGGESVGVPRSARICRGARRDAHLSFGLSTVALRACCTVTSSRAGVSDAPSAGPRRGAQAGGGGGVGGLVGEFAVLGAPGGIAAMSDDTALGDGACDAATATTQ